MGGSGGSTSVDTRAPAQEKENVKNWYTMQQNQLGKYVGGSPLLSTAQSGALDWWNTLMGTGTGSLAAAAGRNANQINAESASRGMATTNQGLAAELLGRQEYAQGAVTQGLNNLIGTQEAETGTFSQLTNPALTYLGNLFGGNQQASIAQAQINQQGNLASQAKTGDLIGGAISSIGSIAGAAAMSDERIKEKIRDTGVKTKEGIPFKVFEYATRPGVMFLGHTAQDVEKKRPDAVITDPVSGLKMIDFIKLGSRMVQLEPYGKAAA